MTYCRQIPATGRCLSSTFIDEIITAIQQELAPVDRRVRIDSRATASVGGQFFERLLLPEIRRLAEPDRRETLERFEDKLAALRLEIVAAPETVAMTEEEIRVIVGGAQSPKTVTMEVVPRPAVRILPMR